MKRSQRGRIPGPVASPVAALGLARGTLLAVSLLSLGSSGLAGCGLAGQEPYARWQLLRVEEGGYSLRYLSPPWELLELEGDRARLFIESASMRLLPDAGLSGKYELEADLRPGRADLLAAEAARDAAAAGQEIEEGPREFEGGWELLSRRLEEERHFRSVFFEHPRGTLRLRFEATPRLDTEEIEAMIRAVEIEAP